MVYLNCENGLTQFAGKYVRTRLKSIEKRPLQTGGKDFQQT